MLSIEYIYKLNVRATDITYKIVTIIKKAHNYENDYLVINAYYQALRKLKELNKRDIASEITSVTKVVRESQY